MQSRKLERMPHASPKHSKETRKSSTSNHCTKESAKYKKKRRKRLMTWRNKLLSKPTIAMNKHLRSKSGSVHLPTRLFKVWSIDRNSINRNGFNSDLSWNKLKLRVIGRNWTLSLSRLYSSRRIKRKMMAISIIRTNIKTKDLIQCWRCKDYSRELRRANWRSKSSLKHATSIYTPFNQR